MKKQKNKLTSKLASQSRLSIIILNYNSWQWTKQCLESLANLVSWDQSESPQQGPVGIEVIVVDNNSTASPLTKVNQSFPFAKTIQSDRNLGFAAGNNLGIKIARAPFVMLLNADTVFKPKTDLLALLDNLKKDQVGVVTPRIELSDGQLDHACHRGFPTPWNSAMYFSGLAKRFPKVKWLGGYQLSWQDLSQAHQIDACSGAAMIVRAQALKEVGLLDEDYFMYAEDIDWCYRFKQAGYQVWYDPQVTVIHFKHKTGLKNQEWKTRKRTINAFYDTMIQFMQKNYQGRYPWLVLQGSFVMIKLLKILKIWQERTQYE